MLRNIAINIGLFLRLSLVRAESKNNIFFAHLECNYATKFNNAIFHCSHQQFDKERENFKHSSEILKFLSMLR